MPIPNIGAGHCLRPQSQLSARPRSRTQESTGREVASSCRHHCFGHPGTCHSGPTALLVELLTSPLNQKIPTISLDVRPAVSRTQRPNTHRMQSSRKGHDTITLLECPPAPHCINHTFSCVAPTRLLCRWAALSSDCMLRKGCICPTAT